MKSIFVPDEERLYVEIKAEWVEVTYSCSTTNRRILICRVNPTQLAVNNDTSDDFQNKMLDKKNNSQYDFKKKRVSQCIRNANTTFSNLTSVPTKATRPTGGS